MYMSDRQKDLLKQDIDKMICVLLECRAELDDPNSFEWDSGLNIECMTRHLDQIVQDYRE